MALAQRLYEGVELGDEGPTGLITYMRTDSTRISDDAIAAVRAHITDAYGADYLPAEPNTYSNKARAQDAHEAIRPTLMEWTPERVAVALEQHPEGPELIKLYTLIWQRFVASQMVPAVYDSTTVDLDRGAATLRATGQVMKFAGYTQHPRGRRDRRREGRGRPARGQAVAAARGRRRDHARVRRPACCAPRSRRRWFSEAFVKELEERGIGRLPTYASIMSTIVDRGYVEKKEARFWPTEPR